MGSHASLLHFEVPPPCDLPKLFNFTSLYAEDLVLSFSVSQNSLDQAFISFVKEQEDPGGRRRSHLAFSAGDVCAVANPESDAGSPQTVNSSSPTSTSSKAHSSENTIYSPSSSSSAKTSFSDQI
ncbi:hypothetical protein GCK32_019442 [Trichostrongylus colubriformis]|uniref:Uncharacterized protein n=1 Tax=Trichostrongylus colubriformis TaxID=6319 RepID=A0AAN8FX01_TRICO